MTIALLLSLTYLISSAEPLSSATDESSTFSINQAASNDAYKLLLHAFADEGNSVLMSYFPDYYAGAYIDSNGYLVVLTKNAIAADLKKMRDICKTGISFKDAQYSYNELIAIRDSIAKRGQEMMENSLFDNKAFNISIRDNENKVHVAVSNPEDTQVQEYLTRDIKTGSEISRTESIMFDKAEPQKPCANLTPGNNIYAGHQGSVAFKAQLTYNGVTRIGFVTAGHVTNGSNAFVTWWLLGKVGNTIVEQVGGNADAAFCELTGSNTFSNTVNGYSITPGLYVTPAVGSTVSKIGNQSGTTSGTILSNMSDGYMVHNGGLVWMTNQIQTTVSAVGGDSGGLLYSVSGSAARVVGIVSNSVSTYYYYSNAALMPWDIWPIN